MKQQHKIVIRSAKPSGYKITLYKKTLVFWKKIDSWEDAIPYSFKTRKAVILHKIPDERVLFKFKTENRLFI